jgi:hypothetical protein
MAGRQGSDRTIARENARLTGRLRRIRERLEEALRRADRRAAPRHEQAAEVTAPARIAQLERETRELRRALAEARGLAEIDRSARERDVDRGSEGEEKGRMSPPIGEVVDELRRRR